MLNYDWENANLDSNTKCLVFLSILFNEVPFPKFLSHDIAKLEPPPKFDIETEIAPGM